MLTTDGLILATSAATSGVPDRSGGLAKGAGVAGSGSAAATRSKGEAAPDALGPCALAAGGCFWQPAASASGRTTSESVRRRLAEDRIPTVVTGGEAASFPGGISVARNLTADPLHRLEAAFELGQTGARRRIPGARPSLRRGNVNLHRRDRGASAGRWFRRMHRRSGRLGLGQEWRSHARRLCRARRSGRGGRLVAPLFVAKPARRRSQDRKSVV